MTPKLAPYLEKAEPYFNGTLYTYLTFRGDTTGMINLVYREKEKTISEAKNFRVAFEGEYTTTYPMLGSAEAECLTKITNILCQS